ncbi:hypothetical protein CQ010_07120 [Arthrobacter sp. MYb211]|uniref:hypothetical protein n=1 Tax=unclassified Arthrobacter TaxID=235627 RepID=UPI000CFDECA9|nr:MULTISPECIES: hypothetical protein [unclassified Arthrobacter]PRA11856.1 hypothetical protein CQ015_07815 [Arthrobacter sp. MYb221]PRC08211.1 hypothetical protein CQ010_07120 [Arthrobacter sp. MYb211]
MPNLGRSQPGYSTSLAKAIPLATEEKPDSERHGRSRIQFTLWFPVNMVLAVMMPGFFCK